MYLWAEVAKQEFDSANPCQIRAGLGALYKKKKTFQSGSLEGLEAQTSCWTQQFFFWRQHD